MNTGTSVEQRLAKAIDLISNLEFQLRDIELQWRDMDHPTASSLSERLSKSADAADRVRSLLQEETKL